VDINKKILILNLPMKPIEKNNGFFYFNKYLFKDSIIFVFSGICIIFDV
jgi:hypothetical protein